MHLRSLQIRCFRNLERVDLSPHPQFNFIYGRNAQGKTSILESVYVLSQLKSFRTSDRKQLIRTGSVFSHIEAGLMHDDLSTHMALTLTAAERKVLVNDKPPRTRKDYLALMPVVLFEPRHIYLFRDSPSVRRQYLNRATYLLDAATLTTLNEYEKVVSQKNRLLKDRGDLSLLDVWNERLVELGSALIQQRLQWFHDIAPPLRAEYQRVSGTAENLQLVYRASVGEELSGCRDVEMSGSQDVRMSEGRIRKIFSDRLAERAEDEWLRREALVGPHRDDFSATIDGRDVGLRASQGENRSVLIAMKLAQLGLFRERCGFAPVFLLDDVASELDESRCQHLFSTLRDAASQVFLTTTENRLNILEFKGFSCSFLVESGAVQVLD